MNVKFDDVSKSFEGVSIFKNLNFEIDKGEKVVITGDSASGKTTIINLILGFNQPDKGNILICNEKLNTNNIHKFRSRMGLLPQDFPFTNGVVRDIICKPFSFKRNKGLSPTEDEITQLLSGFSLGEKILDKMIHELSGGQKQRIGIVTIILLKKTLFLLDEPTSALDKGNKNTLMDFLFKNNEQTIISTSHDPEWIERCDKIIEL